MDPLILTLRLDEQAFRFFNDLRQQHFPPERNWLQAHLTLFHHLPDTPELGAAVQQAAAALSGPIALEVTGLQKLGNGVAYKIESKQLLALHRSLQLQWQHHLKPQDKQILKPQVTVQNKVAPPLAEQLHQQLSASFQPFNAWGVGLELWHYLGGPWKAAAYFNFGDTNSRTD